MRAREGRICLPYIEIASVVTRVTTLRKRGPVTLTHLNELGRLRLWQAL